MSLGLIFKILSAIYVCVLSVHWLSSNAPGVEFWAGVGLASSSLALFDLVLEYLKND